ncbi:MAG: phage terminase small subunit P27 family [Archangium gephyra]|uniref:Phage terminase small subunit P27 family n=1 Tax=Archangium gephyra TaxID=48 RepID=A0A2W5SZ75_9BACT|nr:MAG: phage terminase small subunit P27 family [Archangium gephyra]
MEPPVGGKGSGGHNRLPTSVKRARGTLKKSREVAEPVSIGADAPVNTAPPTWLTKTAKTEWHRVVPLLDGAKLLTEADRTALAMYCTAVDRAQKAEKQIERDGMTVVNPTTGAMHAHPLLTVAKEARAQALRYGCEFGLTPASRGKMGSPGAPKDAPDADPLSQFLGAPKLALVNNAG